MTLIGDPPSFSAQLGRSQHSGRVAGQALGELSERNNG